MRPNYSDLSYLQLRNRLAAFALAHLRTPPGEGETLDEYLSRLVAVIPGATPEEAVHFFADLHRFTAGDKDMANTLLMELVAE